MRGIKAIQLNKVFVFLGVATLFTAICIPFGYSPSKIEIFCAYIACAFTFIGKGLESNENQ